MNCWKEENGFYSVRLAVAEHEDRYTEKQILEYFQMPVPTYVEITLDRAVIQKMFALKDYMQQENVGHMWFLDKTRACPFQNSIKLFHHDFEMPIAFYEEYENRFYPVCDNHFYIHMDKIQQPKHSQQLCFSADFLYTSTQCHELGFKTESVLLDMHSPLKQNITV